MKRLTVTLADGTQRTLDSEGGTGSPSEKLLGGQVYLEWWTKTATLEVPESEKFIRLLEEHV